MRGVEGKGGYFLLNWKQHLSIWKAAEQYQFVYQIAHYPQGEGPQLFCVFPHEYQGSWRHCVLCLVTCCYPRSLELLS